MSASNGKIAKRSQKKAKKQAAPRITKREAMAAMQALAEVKAVDTTVALKCNDSGVSFESIGGIFEGTKPYQRIGRSTKIQSIHFKGYFQVSGTGNATAAALGPVFIRVFILHNPDGWVLSAATPPTADIYRGVNGAGGNINTPTTGRNLVYTDNYKVLAVKEFTLYTQITAAGTVMLLDTKPKVIEWFLNKQNIVQKYLADTNVSGVSGGIGIYVQSNNAVGDVTNFITLHGTARIKFTDS